MAALLAWMARAVVTGDIPLTGDLLHWNYPIRDFYATALASDWRLTWMPGLFAGFDVAGEGQLGVYHPLHRLLYGVVALDRAFALELVVFYPVAFAGMWLWLRRYTDDVSSTVGAFLFTFSGFTLSHVVHPNLVAVVAHIPWLLWLVERAATDTSVGSQLTAAGAIALATGSQVLFGHPQALWWSLLLVTAFTLWRARVEGADRPWRVLAAVAVGTLLGAAVGGVQLLATLSAAAHSTRPIDDPNYATQFSLRPWQLLQLLAPYAQWGRVWRWNDRPDAWDEFAVYGGAVGLSLTTWWLGARGALRASGRLTRADALAGWALVLAVVGLWLATGRYGRLYYLQTLLPVVGRFRAPVRFVLFAQLGFSVAAATAWAHLAAVSRGAMRHVSLRTAIGPWTLVVASAVVSFIDARAATSGSAPTTASLLLGPLVFAVVALSITLAMRGYTAALLALVVCAAADQAVYGLGGIVGWQDSITRPAAEALLDTRESSIPTGEGRLARGGFPNLYLLGGYRLLDGYAGLTPVKQLDYHGAHALGVAGVAYAHEDFFRGVSVPGGEALKRGWRKLPTPQPRFRLVSVARVTDSPATEIEATDVATTALVPRALALTSGATGEVRVTRDVPGEIDLETDSSGRQLLVVSESYHDGWQGVVDGHEAPIERVNGDFMGVVVPSGRHQLQLRFAPAYASQGMALTTVGTGLALLLLVGGGVAGFRKPSCPPTDQPAGLRRW